MVCRKASIIEIQYVDTHIFHSPPSYGTFVVQHRSVVMMVSHRSYMFTEERSDDSQLLVELGRFSGVWYLDKSGGSGEL